MHQGVLMLQEYVTPEAQRRSKVDKNTPHRPLTTCVWCKNSSMKNMKQGIKKGNKKDMQRKKVLRIH